MTHANKEHEDALILVREINNLLDQKQLPLKRLAGRIAPDLPPELEGEVIKLKKRLQQFQKILGGDPVPNGTVLSQFTGGRRAVEETPDTPSAGESNASGGQEEGTLMANRDDQIDPAPEAPKSPVRPRNKGFDLLLIAAPYARKEFGYPISHDVLFELAKHYDPKVTRATMVSKVNRYKNDKEWLSWRTSEDIQITPKGKEAFATLRLLAARDGNLPYVQRTFQEIWGIDLPF